MNNILTDKNDKRKYYLIYSGIFLFCALFFVFYLGVNGKTNINYKNDGMNVYYRSLIYYSRYLKNIFSDGQFIFKQWDFSLGEGSDILHVMHSCTIGDPFSLISILFNDNNMYIAYMLIVLLKIYLAGIFFIELCLYMGRTGNGVIAGGLVYSFCFWSLQNMVFHIFFITPLMYYPLIILGIEKVINEKKPILFVIAVFLSLISSLYFFYMLGLSAGLYGLLRIINKYKNDFKTIFKKLCELLIYAVFGMLLGAIIFIPMFLAYTGDTRISSPSMNFGLYPRFFYERLFTIFVSNDSAYDLYLGFVSPSLLAIVLLFRNYKKNYFLLIINILCAVFLLFPVFGQIFNGFSYVSQRWCFVIALPVAYNLVVAWDEFKKNKKILLLSLPVIFCVAFFSAWARNERVIVPVLICFIFCFIAVLDEKLLKVQFSQFLLIGLIVFNILYIFEYNLSSRGGDLLNDLMSVEDARNFTMTSEAYLMKDYMKDENDFYRYSGNYLTNNASMLYGVHSTNSYWSITNPYDQQFRLDVGLRDRLSWQLNGYDDRAQLESLANVKYYVYDKTFPGIIPYGFEFKENIDGYDIYENKYVLPFGYGYKEAVSYEQWYKSSPVERQELMMDRIVLDSADNSDLYLSSNKIQYDVKCEDGIEFVGKSIVVRDPDATISFRFDDDGNKEKYIEFVGLEFEDSENMIEDDYTATWVICRSDDRSSSFIYMPKGHRYAYNKSEYVCYLSQTIAGSNIIEVSFSLPGTYTFEEINIYGNDMNDYKDKIDNLSNKHLKNVVFETNTVKGEIDLDEDQYILLSIPYSKGWKVIVDGRKGELLKGNIHYSALKLDAGHHTIEMKYTTPGLIPGAIISAICFVMLIVYLYFDKKNRKAI